MVKKIFLCILVFVFASINISYSAQGQVEEYEQFKLFDEDYKLRLINTEVQNATSNFLRHNKNGEKYLQILDAFITKNAKDYKKLGGVYTRVTQYLYSKVDSNTDLVSAFMMRKDDTIFKLLYVFHKKLEYHLKGNLPVYKITYKANSQPIESVADGKYLSYYDTGELNRIQYAINGKMIFEDIVFHKNKKVYFSGDVLDGKYIGMVDMYDENGDFLEKYYYSHWGILEKVEKFTQEPTGFWGNFSRVTMTIYFNEKWERVKVEELDPTNFDNPKNIYYFKNNVPYLKEVYEDIHPFNPKTKQDSWKSISVLKWTIPLDSQGESHGKAIFYDYEFDQVEKKYKSMELDMVHGKKEGIVIQYYPNGKIRNKTQYKNGEEYGTAIFYDENGEKTTEIEIVDGQKYRQVTPFVNGKQGASYFVDENFKEIK